MTLAVLPASFDPITCGHVDIARRAHRLFGALVMAVYARPKKRVLFSLDERMQMVSDSLEGIQGVEVAPFEGLIVDFCRSRGADVLVRGLRTVGDFEYEWQQATLNRQMLPGLEVVCLFAGAEYSAFSSSMVKEIAENGGDVSSMVPEPVLPRLKAHFSQQSPSLASGG